MLNTMVPIAQLDTSAVCFRCVANTSSRCPTPLPPPHPRRFETPAGTVKTHLQEQPRQRTRSVARQCPGGPSRSRCLCPQVGCWLDGWLTSAVSPAAAYIHLSATPRSPPLCQSRSLPIIQCASRGGLHVRWKMPRWRPSEAVQCQSRDRISFAILPTRMWMFFHTPPPGFPAVYPLPNSLHIYTLSVCFRRLSRAMTASLHSRSVFVDQPPGYGPHPPPPPTM